MLLDGKSNGFGVVTHTHKSATRGIDAHTRRKHSIVKNSREQTLSLLSRINPLTHLPSTHYPNEK